MSSTRHTECTAITGLAPADDGGCQRQVLARGIESQGSKDRIRTSLVAVLLIAVAGSVPAQWAQLGADIDGDVEGDQSGIAVAMSADGSRLAIGARLHDLAAGQVRVFDWSGGGWVQFNQDILGEAQDDNAGSAVALSANGSRVAVGAWGHDGVADRAGYVRVFDQSGPAWDQIGDDIEGVAATDFAGAAVALSANGLRLAIGAPSANGSGVSSGLARVYTTEIFIDGFESGDTSAWSGAQ